MGSKTLGFLGLAFVFLAGACTKSEVDNRSPGDSRELPSLHELKLKAAKGIRYKTTGTNYADDESFAPGDFDSTSTFEEVVSADYENDKLHIDSKVTLLFEAITGTKLESKDVIHATKGSRTNGSSVFDNLKATDAPKDVPLSSGYLGAIRRQARLLDPYHFIFKYDSNKENYSTTKGNTLQDKSNGDQWVFDLDAETLQKLESKESGNLRRDVNLRVEYGDWKMVDGRNFPHTASLFFDNKLVRKEVRSEVTFNPNFETGLFELPDFDSSGFDEKSILAGELNRQTPITLRNLGIAPAQIFGTAQGVVAKKISEGVFHLGGGATASLVVEQSDYLILVEAPLNEKRSLDILKWADKEFDSKKPIRYVVPTHHHQDHAAGVRNIMADKEVTLVVADSVADFWRNKVLGAESTLIPDFLEIRRQKQGSLDFKIMPVESSLSLGDSRPVVIHRIKTQHAEDMVIAVIKTGTDTLVFEGDIYNLGVGTLTKTGPHDFITKLQGLGLIDSACKAKADTSVTISATHGAGASEQVATTIALLKKDKRELPCE